MIFNEALITNSQLTLFAMLAGVVFALIKLTFTHYIAIFFQLALLVCFIKMIMRFAKNKLTFYKAFLALNYPKSWI
jgi:hypothetical protein